MAQQIGAAAPPVQRRVEATTVSMEQAAPAGSFTVRVVCYATRTLEFWRGGVERLDDRIVQRHATWSTATTFAISNLDELRSDTACRGALRGMLPAIPELQWLRLAEDEWDVVVPGNVVSDLVGAAGRGDGFTFHFLMRVKLRGIHDERALLMAGKEWLPSTVSGEKDCAICLDEQEREPAVVLPGCPHAFHRRCVSGWFSTDRTCPICRGNVWDAALPVFIEMADRD